MKAFRWIYVNCFNRLRFLAEVSTTWGAIDLGFLLRSVQNGEPKKVISSWSISRAGASLSEEIYMSYWRTCFMLGRVAPYLANRVHDSTVCGAKWVMLFWFICYRLADLLGSYENYQHSRYIQWVLAFEVVVCGSIWGMYTPFTWVSDVWLSETFVKRVFFASFVMIDIIRYPSWHLSILFLLFLQVSLWLFLLAWILWFLWKMHSLMSTLVILQFLWVIFKDLNHEIKGFES